MQVKNLQIVFVIAAVVLAGCVGQPGTVGSGTAGVIITSFSPELPEIESGSKVLFLTTVKNVGDLEAKNVKLEVLGLEEWTGTTTKDISSLKPADPQRGLEGEESLQDFELTAPTKQVGVTYTPAVRVTYNYESRPTIQFAFPTREAVRGTPQQSTATVTQTGGPFVVSVRGNLPIISSEKKEATVQIEVQNVGGGRAAKGSGTADVDFIRLSIASQSGATFACTPTGDVRLVGGKSRLISCKITFTNVPTAGTATATLDLKLEYAYFVETAASVTVLKEIK